MSATLLIVIGLVCFAIGYFVYSKFVAEKIYALDPNYVTPAHSMKDGVDYVPTNRFVLWGHHFTSVAGAAPIVGPAIAVIWGWAPAFAWVVLGTIFFAGVHDFGALWASVRNKGQSIGSLTANVLGPRARNVFMLVIFLLLLMVNAVFAVVIAGLLVRFPTSVIPIWGAIVVALAIGQLIYRHHVGLLWPSVIGVVVLYAMIWLGQAVPITLPDSVFGMNPTTQWILLLFIYAGIASLLPVWVLLQPRDYINGLQLFVGLILLYGATVLAGPSIVVPAFNTDVPPGTPSFIPLLFVTIACGAVSGFHGLVSSGTSSKQLNKETDARFVGYFGAVGEGMLALAAIVCATAGFASLEAWKGVYTQFSAGGVNAFVEGGANILSNGIGLDVGISATILTVMAALFAGTTMDTGLRLQRYVVQEVGEITGAAPLKSGMGATFIALACCLALAFGAGSGGTGGMLIWPLFGTTNQLLAGLTLSIIAVMLMRLRRPVIYVLIPLVFLLTMSIFALFIQLGTFVSSGQWLLVTLNLAVLAAAMFVTFEAVMAMKREREAQATQAAE
ncbi:carbon starvation protein A [Aureimonas altamirensis]|uniref:carbon starvation CstA family protein n=1 Tax=Aureimonas TaxID=414371 RepID=UPI00177BB4E0|nr:carbon starvation protein A [Aureimonas sp. OT7]MCM2504250.1 carbon starvation protein A [Aureimonas altamirensis]QOG05166.1 carbon starvation protein A [Aureimonas sp. OT7]